MDRSLVWSHLYQLKEGLPFSGSPLGRSFEVSFTPKSVLTEKYVSYRNPCGQTTLVTGEGSTLHRQTT